MGDVSVSIIIRPKILQTRPVGVSRDGWRKIRRDAMRAMGEHWFKEMLPQHFDANAKYKYKHRPRSTKYKANKLKLAQRGKVQGGGVTDLVFSGRTRDALLNNIAIIRPFPSRVTVRMQGPPYLTTNFRAKSNQPNKPREITTVTEAERKELARVARDKAVEGIKSFRESKTINP